MLNDNGVLDLRKVEVSVAQLSYLRVVMFDLKQEIETLKDSIAFMERSQERIADILDELIGGE